MSYVELQRYFDVNFPEKSFQLEEKIIPQMKAMAADTIKAVYKKIDPKRHHHTFELFGYDFMIDEDLKVWLIEVNTNPCLELSSSHLA